MKLIGLIFWLLPAAFATDLKPGEIVNAFATWNGVGPQYIAISIIDHGKADTLFRKFAQDKSIPFKYFINGCAERATAMAKSAADEKIRMGKIFAEGDLQVKTDDPRIKVMEWGYHVATVVYVKQPNEKIELLVFDPSLFDRPVPVEEWKTRMLDKSNGYPPRIDSIHFGSRYQFLNHRNSPVEQKHWTYRDLFSTWSNLREYRALLKEAQKKGTGIRHPSEKSGEQ